MPLSGVMSLPSLTSALPTEVPSPLGGASNSPDGGRSPSLVGLRRQTTGNFSTPDLLGGRKSIGESWTALPTQKLERRKRGKHTTMRLENEVLKLPDGCADLANDDTPLKGTHDALLSRMRSRAVKQEAERCRCFLDQYRAPGPSTQQRDGRLNMMLHQTEQKIAEQLTRTDTMQAEVEELTRRLDRANGHSVRRTSDEELAVLTAVERQQERIQEDKQEEELRRTRDEAQTALMRVQRPLQLELQELRDYKILMQELRRLRLEKLQDNLCRVEEGQHMRATLREMIRHGARKVLVRLEQAQVPLDGWMRDVLANSCHLEVRIEDAKVNIQRLRKQAFGALEDDMSTLSTQNKQERIRALRARAGAASPHSTVACPEDATPLARSRTGRSDSGLTASVASPGSWTASVTSPGRPPPSVESPNARRIPDALAAEISRKEAEVAGMHRLLQDMQDNTAAVVCGNIANSSQGSKACEDEAYRTLTLCFSEDFALATLKRLKKDVSKRRIVKS